MPLVVDASTALSWCFPDEDSPRARAVRAKVWQEGGVVPAIWPIEVANGLVVGERRQRLTYALCLQAIETLGLLPFSVDQLPAARALATVLNVARRYDLSSYDAAYLELALREGLPLATQDTRLRTAAERAGVPLVT